MRRTLVKQQPIKRVRKADHLAGKQHHHACSSCRAKFCCSCQAPNDPRRCNQCVSGVASSWHAAHAPRPCCTDTRLLRTSDELDRFRLVGGPWFICNTCARQFSFQPSKEDIT